MPIKGEKRVVLDLRQVVVGTQKMASVRPCHLHTSPPLSLGFRLPGEVDGTPWLLSQAYCLLQLVSYKIRPACKSSPGFGRQAGTSPMQTLQVFVERPCAVPTESRRQNVTVQFSADNSWRARRIMGRAISARGTRTRGPHPKLLLDW